jgi:hypothetical protein
MNGIKKNLQNSIRNFFSKIWNKEFLIFLFFLFLSSAFWLFQAVNEVYEQDYRIPVVIENVPDGVIITTEPVAQIETRLRDRAATLLNYRYGGKFSPIVIDFKAFANPSGHVRFLTKEVLKQFSSQLASSTQIITTKPDTIEFYYNHGLHKRVPVTLEGDVKAENGYVITHTQLSEDSVTVYAAGNLLETIKSANVKVDYLKNVNDTTSLSLPIQSVRGAKFLPASVKLDIFVDRLVEKKVRVPILPEGFPADQILLPIPQEVEVTFQVGMNRYREITSDDFVVVASYKDLPKNGNSQCPLQVRIAPKGISQIRISPKEVEYVIEKVTPTQAENP